MDAYSHFMNTHTTAIIRIFFAIITAIDLLFIYAALFNRDLPPRLATWFFGTLSGQPVSLPKHTAPPPWWTWLVFAFISAVPPIAWALFEWHNAQRAPAPADRALPLLLWRGIPSILFLSLSIPLFRRLIRGVIPADDGNPHPIRRTESPKKFWSLMIVHLAILAILAAWLAFAWCKNPPATDPALPAMPMLR